MVIRRWPFVPMAVLLIAGIAVARFTDTTSAFGLTVLGVAAALGLVRYLRWAALAAGIFALGMFLYARRYEIRSETDLRLYFPGEPELVTMRGRIVETPSTRQFSQGTNAAVYSHSIIAVTEILQKKEWLPASGKVASQTRGEVSGEFVEGRLVEVTGVLESPSRAKAPGLFDYRAYLENLRIFHQLKCDSTNDWRLLSHERMPLTEQFRRWAEVQLQRGMPRDEQIDLILAMSLGKRSALGNEATEPFIKTGTMHIFAVSGLHVACIAGFIVYLLQWVFGFSREKAGSLGVPLIWFYTLATGWQSSAIRAALMFTVIIAGRILKRPSDLLNSTAAAAVLILLFQPEQQFQPGFQLSFAVVASLALLMPALQKFQLPLLRADPFLPRSLWPRWRSWIETASRPLGSMLAISVASWIGSLPLIAYYFNMVTLSSFMANLVAVPLSSIALGSTVFSMMIPPAGPIFNYFAWAFMWHTMHFTRLCAEIPFSFFYVQKPGPLFFLFYFSAVALIFIPALRKWKVWTLPIVLVLGAAWVAAAVLGRPLATITVLPCAGAPALMRIRNEPNLLVDTSSERDAETVVKRFLHAQGLGNVNALLLTHGDAHHSGGFQLLWDEFRPRQVFVSGARSRSPVYRKAIQLLENLPERKKTIAAGDQMHGWTILHPPSGRGFSRSDDNAVVLKRHIGPWTVVHLADLGRLGQKQLVESGTDLEADIVIAGMPDQDEPLQDEILETIHPKVIILGTSKYPYRAEGSPELRSRLENTGATLFYTSETDAVTVEVRADRCAFRSMSGQAFDLHRSFPNATND